MWYKEHLSTWSRRAYVALCIIKAESWKKLFRISRKISKFLKVFQKSKVLEISETHKSPKAFCEFTHFFEISPKYETELFSKNFPNFARYFPKLSKMSQHFISKSPETSRNLSKLVKFISSSQNRPKVLKISQNNLWEFKVQIWTHKTSFHFSEYFPTLGFIFDMQFFRLADRGSVPWALSFHILAITAIVIGQGYRCLF